MPKDKDENTHAVKEIEKLCDRKFKSKGYAFYFIKEENPIELKVFYRHKSSKCPKEIKEALDE